MNAVSRSSLVGAPRAPALAKAASEKWKRASCTRTSEVELSGEQVQRKSKSKGC